MMIPGGDNHSVYPNHSNSYNCHHILHRLDNMYYSAYDSSHDDHP